MQPRDAALGKAFTGDCRRSARQWISLPKDEEGVPIVKTRMLAAALALVAAMPAAAQLDQLTWIRGGVPEAPTLLFGLPNSDYAAIAFRCAADIDGIMVTYDREPTTPVAGAKVPIDISGDGGYFLIDATTVFSEMLGGYYLEGTIPNTELLPILVNGDILYLMVEDGTEEFLLPEVAMVRDFFAACAPFA
jgi:hypothetical protein